MSGEKSYLEAIKILNKLQKNYKNFGRSKVLKLPNRQGWCLTNLKLTYAAIKSGKPLYHFQLNLCH